MTGAKLKRFSLKFTTHYKSTLTLKILKHTGATCTCYFSHSFRQVQSLQCFHVSQIYVIKTCVALSEDLGSSSCVKPTQHFISRDRVPQVRAYKIVSKLWVNSQSSIRGFKSTKDRAVLTEHSILSVFLLCRHFMREKIA